MIKIVNFIAEILVGKQSRKTAFGIWLFWVANVFKMEKDLPWEIWWWCVVLSAALIGFGTLADKIIEKFGDAIIFTFKDKFGNVTKTEAHGAPAGPA